MDNLYAALLPSDYEYLSARGFTREDADRLMIGRVTDGYLKGRLFLPYFKNGAVVYYATRAMPDSAFQDNKYMKASLNESASYQHIPWGLQTLSRQSDTLIISEGYFDAISWEREGYAVISPITGNFSSAQWPDVISACRMFNRVLIIFDNDDISHAGDSFTERTATRLFRENIPFLVAHTPTGIKDVNDYYANGGDLAELITKAIDGTTFMLQRCKSLDEIETFILSVKRFMSTAALTSALESLDLSAGVIRELKKLAESVPPEPQIADEVMKSHNLIYVNNVGFYEWNNKIWERIEDNVVKSYAVEAYGRFTNYQRVSAVCNLLKVLTARDVSFDRAQVLTFQNGTLEIETGNFRDFSQADYCSIIMDYNYDASARCPAWEHFINDVTDESPERVDVLQTLAGYTLIPDCRFQKIFILLGAGSNGKSVYLEIIQALFGKQNVSVVSPSGLTKEFQRVKLKDSLLNIGKDVSPDFSTGEIREWLLQISDGTLVQACYKGQTHITFEPRCKLIYSMNEPPEANVIKGLNRRLRFIQFPCSYVDFPDPNDHQQKQKDVDIIPKLLAELPGIFNWAYAGYKLLTTVGYFTDTPEQSIIMRQFEEISDPVAVFCDEHVFTGRRTRDFIYQQYTEWCDLTGHKKLSREKFIPKFRDIAGLSPEDEYKGRDGERWVRGFDFDRAT